MFFIELILKSMRLRQKYYDIFSHFYDQFIKLHSRDKQENLRKYLFELISLKENDRVLDLCCGTGANLVFMKKYVFNGIYCGIDFSRGMLRKAKEKIPEAILICGDVEYLPFRSEIFDVITYTYAFYELEGDKVEKTLNEIKRVLKPEGKLYIMEHEMPQNFFIKMLYFIRIASMGLKKAIQILKHEISILKRVFPKVEKIVTPSGNSKIIICQKEY